MTENLRMINVSLLFSIHRTMDVKIHRFNLSRYVIHRLTIIKFGVYKNLFFSFNKENNVFICFFSPKQRKNNIDK